MVCTRSGTEFSCECARMVLCQMTSAWDLLVFHPPCGQRAFPLDMDVVPDLGSAPFSSLCPPAASPLEAGQP